MATLLSLSSFSSLFTYLNVILVGVVVFFAVNRFTYIVDVIIYALAKTFIPIITSLMLGSILETNVSFSIGTVLLLLVLYFILGLIVIKITEKVAEYFGTDTILYFIVIFSIIDSVLCWLFSLIIGLFG